MPLINGSSQPVLQIFIWREAWFIYEMTCLVLRWFSRCIRGA